MAKLRGDATPVLTADHLQELRDALLRERDALIRQVKALSSDSLTSNRQAGEELADVGSDDFIRETELHLMSEESNLLTLINQALESIENGTYGTCFDCSKAISLGRLRAKPYARLCIDCKTIREQQEEMGGAVEDDREVLVED